MTPDLMIVGSGMVGLACAWAGVQRELKVTVVDRDVQCVGASIRNFGLITLAGQGRGDTWRRARRSRNVWAELAPQAGTEVLQQGLLVLAHRPEGAEVLQHLLTQPAGQELRWLDAQALHEQAPHLAHDAVLGALQSPHELRIESRLAVEQLRLYLQACGIRFHMGQAVQQVAHAEQQAELDEGIHLIIVQSANACLEVGDSHHYGQAMPPFASAQVEALILAFRQRLLRLPHFEMVSSWTGVYPSAEQDAFFAPQRLAWRRSASPAARA